MLHDSLQYPYRRSLFIVIVLLTRQLLWKPTVAREVNIHLVHAVIGHFDAFLTQGLCLPLCASGAAMGSLAKWDESRLMIPEG